MQIIIHRINKVEELKKVPKEYGVEVDVRLRNDRLILNHDAFEDGELLEDYLNEFNHAFLILDVKEEGIEKEAIELCKKHNISNYFLLSVSLPFIYILSKEGIKNLVIRFSEFEDISAPLNFKDNIDWVWVDTFTKNPLTRDAYEKIKKANFKICLVCPERWGREEDIVKYKEQMEKEDIKIDAVMTSLKHAKTWG